MYQLPMLMMTSRISVPRETKSPCAHNAPRPYGLSTVSFELAAAGTGATASDAAPVVGAAADAAGSCANAAGVARKAPRATARHKGAKREVRRLGRFMVLFRSLNR